MNIIVKFLLFIYYMTIYLVCILNILVLVYTIIHTVLLFVENASLFVKKSIKKYFKYIQLKFIKTYKN